MKIKVILHSYLRELLPPETQGQTTLELPENSTISDILHILEITTSVACALNENYEPDKSKILKDGDVLRVLRPGAGG